jgi:hypothetical protein
MKRLLPAQGSFLVAYCCAYIVLLANDWPMFRYYPLHGDFSWGTGMLKGIGPAMAWYGLMANAAVVALVFGLLVPQSVADRVFRNAQWLFPVAALLGCVFLMRRFFS